MSKKKEPEAAKTENTDNIEPTCDETVEQNQPEATDEASDRINAAEKAVEEYKNRLLLLMADFDNFKKRQAREQAEWGARANERLLADFLPVFDHLELALEKVPEASKEDPFVKGVDMVRTQLAEAFAKHGLKQIDARGCPFDPMLHEALSQIPSDTVPEQSVIQQFRCGWQLGEKLLRPAQVIVSAGKPQEA